MWFYLSAILTALLLQYGQAQGSGDMKTVPDSLLQTDQYYHLAGSWCGNNSFYIKGVQLGEIPLKIKFSVFQVFSPDSIYIQGQLLTKDSDEPSSGALRIGSLERSSYALIIHERVQIQVKPDGNFVLSGRIAETDCLIAAAFTCTVCYYDIGKLVSDLQDGGVNRTR